MDADITDYPADYVDEEVIPLAAGDTHCMKSLQGVQM